MTEWFEDWFETAEYLNVYEHRNKEDARNLFDLIIKNVKLPENAYILDLACGAGRHSILFAQNGFKVTSVDISSNLLNVAEKTARELGLIINFIKSDLRDLRIAQKFHLIVNLFTSFGYFNTDKENEKVIDTASKLLYDKGYFVIDFFNVFHLKKNLIPISFDKIGNGIIKQERSFDERRINKKITITKNDSEKYYHESVRTYSKAQLVEIIENNGLQIQNLFGDVCGNDFEENNSPRIIIIAKK